MSCMSNQAGMNGYSYSSDHPSSSNHQNLQTSTHFLNQFEPNPSEIYNMNPNMEMMIGFPNPTNLMDHSYQQNQMDDPSHDLMMRSSSSCVLFPCEANERPSQGLSLSLSSSNPSTIGLQSFELRQQEDLQFGPSSSNIVQQGHILKYSKYLGPAQELLNEFCNLGIKGNDLKMKKVQKNGDWENDENAIKKQSFFPLDLLELQRRKTKLLHMLEEVDRRYKHYCDQMKSVVSSFEAVAGNGAATVYSALASKAMSRHFRCLRDGILSQIKATKIAIGEKDTVTPGTSKGETPRLRVLDQTLRQQRAFQQMRMMETHPWRPQRGLPERSVSVLRAWLFEHFLHPYPSDVDKHILARQTGLSRSQVSNWFINARVRLWKPMVEEMYIEELKDQEVNLGPIDRTTTDLIEENYEFPNQNPRNEDQKPTHDQLIRIDSECLSSIINNPDKINHSGKKIVGDSSFGAMELDFSAGGAAVYGGGGNFGGGGGVSLTLGLHQSLAFSPASQGSIYQYSMLDSESQTLPYRNLMDAQLLHDLAG